MNRRRSVDPYGSGNFYPNGTIKFNDAAVAKFNYDYRPTNKIL